ncbi:hypothetical protein [Jannaschia sp. S6380]|nr:hypothetical protein [Jannaschia sp. S6380]
MPPIEAFFFAVCLWILLGIIRFSAYAFFEDHPLVRPFLRRMR